MPDRTTSGAAAFAAPSAGATGGTGSGAGLGSTGAGQVGGPAPTSRTAGTGARARAAGTAGIGGSAGAASGARTAGASASATGATGAAGASPAATGARAGASPAATGARSAAGASSAAGATSADADRGPALNLPRVLGHNSLREQVSHALRAALIAGELRPGVVYSAPVLAAGFGVSATPVREAMLDLAKEGLVEVVRNKGFRVTELSESDLDQFTEIRALIEIPVVTGLSRTAPTADLAALRPAAEAIVTAAEARDLIAYVEADQAFHLALLALSGNPHLVEVVSDLRNRSRLYGLPSLADTGVLAASAEEHVQLVDALIARDAATVEALMKTHLTHVRSIWAGRE